MVATPQVNEFPWEGKGELVIQWRLNHKRSFAVLASVVHLHGGKPGWPCDAYSPFEPEAQTSLFGGCWKMVFAMLALPKRGGSPIFA